MLIVPIVQGWRQKLNYENLPKLKAWHLQVQSQMMSVPALGLAPPAINYAGNQSITIQRSSSSSIASRREFLAASDTDRDRTGNLPPDTVVDRGVTSPHNLDFYLQAHAGLQGTAKPTH